MKDGNVGISFKAKVCLNKDYIYLHNWYPKGSTRHDAYLMIDGEDSTESGVGITFLIEPTDDNCQIIGEEIKYYLGRFDRNKLKNVLSKIVALL